MTLLENKANPFQPMQVLCVDLDRPLLDLSCRSDFSSSQAWILVRLHSHVLGELDVEIPKNGLTGEDLALQIWKKLETPIQDHLAKDNVFLQGPLHQAGLDEASPPACLRIREDLLQEYPLVSVVIATRDRLGSLQPCLSSILASDYPNFEVIVVDNAPRSEETARFMRSAFASSTNVRYLREDIPGLAIAHNRALPALKGEIVAFTDDDVLVDRNWLTSLVMNFQQDPMTGCVTGMILPYELETAPQFWIEQFGGFGKGYKRIVYDLKEKRSHDILFPYSAGRFGSGANMAFRTSVLTSLGGFDGALGAGTLAKGGDDLAIFFDVIASGSRLVYEPDALIYHKHRRDYAGLADQAYGYGVGLSAFLMRTIIKYPGRLVDMCSRFPAGLRHLLDPRSQKNRRKKGDYPRELTRLERKGFIKGLFAYLQSRRHLQKLKTRLSKAQKRLSPGFLYPSSKNLSK